MDKNIVLNIDLSNELQLQIERLVKAFLATSSVGSNEVGTVTPKKQQYFWTFDRDKEGKVIKAILAQRGFYEVIEIKKAYFSNKWKIYRVGLGRYTLWLMDVAGSLNDAIDKIQKVYYTEREDCEILNLVVFKNRNGLEDGTASI